MKILQYIYEFLCFSTVLWKPISGLVGTCSIDHFKLCFVANSRDIGYVRLKMCVEWTTPPMKQIMIVIFIFDFYLGIFQVMPKSKAAMYTCIVFYS